MIKDNNNTINVNLDFRTDPPGSGYIENQHENWDPTSIGHPEFKDNVNAAKFNEIERLLNKIAEIIGDVTTGFNEKTIGSKIREVEDKISSQGITSQIYYILAQSGQGVMLGDINSNDYSLNIANGRFDINVKPNTYTTIDINPGICLCGNQENNAKKIIILNETEIILDNSPIFNVGNTNGSNNPILWSDGEIHYIDNSNSIIFLDNHFIKSKGLEVDDGSGNIENVAVVAIDRTNNVWLKDGNTTFSVDMTTGKITNLGGLTQGNWEFFYMYYGWRFDYIYIDTNDSLIKVKSSDEIKNIQQITNDDISNVLFDFASIDEIPLYLILIAPINNNIETDNERCIGLESSNTGCGYSKQILKNINIIDIRRFIGSNGNTFNYTNGITGDLNIIDTDYINRKVLQLDNIELPGSYIKNNNILIQPFSIKYNDITILTQQKIISVNKAVNSPGYKLTEVYVEYPTGNIVTVENDEVPNTDDIKYSQTYFSKEKVNILNVITDNNDIIKTIYGNLSYKYKPYITRIVKKKAGEDIIIRHNLGNDYIAYAIPLTEPDIDPNTSLIHFTYTCNPNLTIFKYNNTNDIYVMISIIPTYNTKDDIKISSSSSTEYTHGDLYNSPMLYIPIHSDDDYVNYGNEMYIEKHYNNDIIHTTTYDDMTVRFARINNMYIDSISFLDINGDSIGIPVSFNTLKKGGLLLQFLASNTEPYWIEYNDISDTAILKFKNTTNTKIMVIDIGNK